MVIENSRPVRRLGESSEKVRGVDPVCVGRPNRELDLCTGLIGLLGLLGPSLSYQEHKQARKMMTSDLIGRFIRAAERIERPGARGKVKSERYLYEVHVPPEQRIEVALINSLVWRTVMQSPEVLTLETKACVLVRALFDRHIKDDGYYLLPQDWRELSSPHHAAEVRARIVADYLSGMTDEYAGILYSRLFLPKHGTVFDMM